MVNTIEFDKPTVVEIAGKGGPDISKEVDVVEISGVEGRVFKGFLDDKAVFKERYTEVTDVRNIDESELDQDKIDPDW